MKVVFLDIDGVLNSEEAAKKKDKMFPPPGWNTDSNIPVKTDKPRKPSKKGGLFGVFQSHLNVLNKLVQQVPDIKFVLSSTWRLGWNLPDIKAYFKYIGFNGDFIGKTCNGWYKYTSEDTDYKGVKAWSKRGEEIKLWLDENPGVTYFVILDDDSDMCELLSHLVKTDFRVGLQEQHLPLVIGLLNREG